MISEPLVSIIMPVYNTGLYVEEAINSVILQSWKNWELIIINDGSSDSSERKILEYDDKRIKYFYQKNSGVSEARNKGLQNCNGQYVCFLDSDDKFPPNSIKSRLEIFDSGKEINFVDGKVESFKNSNSELIPFWEPRFEGNPLNDLIMLSGKSFFGLTWMIKKDVIKGIEFDSKMTHAEDLLFFIEASRRGGIYASTNEIIYQYRQGHQSAMKNIDGLKNGYLQLLEKIENMPNIDKSVLASMKKKVKSILFKSYLRKFNFLSAMKVQFEI